MMWHTTIVNTGVAVRELAPVINLLSDQRPCQAHMTRRSIVRNLENGNMLGALRGHADLITSIALTPESS